ncbi:MAG TPA: hypothetical protein VFB13_17535 [Reyranella sp.]|nr:hypothetical protein [Chloroflexota bacterium]HZQ01352.1 hypothetical protein [Reyranella sp.]
METTFLDTDGIREKLKVLMKEYDEFYWAVAWGSDGPMADRLMRRPAKIVQVVFGTHFCQTDPELLRRLEPYPRAKVMPQSGSGTFHPKVFCFRRGTKLAAIIGSANFTRAASDRNDEAGLFLEGEEGDGPLDDALEYVEGVWEDADEITPDFVAAYRRRYNATKAARKRLSSPPYIPRRQRGGGQQPVHNILEMDWPEYEQAIRGAADAHTVDGRLALLDTAHELLSGPTRFDSLSESERRAIAGLTRDNEVRGIDDWGWFGSMLGSGDFQNRINENDLHISTALDSIPERGEVTRENYDLFLEEFEQAFATTTRKGDVATASRLLTMKRPDYFICLNRKNRVKLGRDIGFAPTTLDFEKYWTNVIEPLTESPWWQKVRPRGDAGRLWDGRVAMLDTIYYDE